MKKRIGVVTTTFYNQKSLDTSCRFRLACQTTKALADAGFLHVNIDNSPVPIVAETLSGLGAHVFREESPGGMGPSRRQGFREALYYLDAGPIQWMEIEKKDYVRYILEVMRQIEDGTYDIVHAGRTEEVWDCYPAFQAGLEREHGKLYGELLGLSHLNPDPYMGPFGCSEEMARKFLAFDPKTLGLPDTYVNIFFPVYAAKKMGARLGFPKVPFRYPLEQKAEEEGPLAANMEKKRLWQAQLMDGVRLLAA